MNPGGAGAPDRSGGPGDAGRRPATRILSDLRRAALDLLFPETGCVVCGGPAPPGWQPEACPACLDAIFRSRAASDGLPLTAPTAGLIDRALTGGAYEGTLERAVLRLKRIPDLRLARFLGRLLAERLVEGGAPALWRGVVPVPLHPSRLGERGFNQAALLARELAGRLGAPLREDICRRVRGGERQSGSGRVERYVNVLGAFRACPEALPAQGDRPGQPWLVVDDVLTTGATAAEVARALKATWPGAVWCVAVARAR